MFACGGRTEPDPDRDALFATATNGAIQRAAPCEEVRTAEVSSSNGLLRQSDLDALRGRIARAEIGDIQRCLAEVNAYNECFLALPCTAFADNAVPAWLAGVSAAPCACGVVDAPFGGPLPQTLANCVGILPVRVAPARPGFACPK
jgi:hypothetical protein